MHWRFRGGYGLDPRTEERWISVDEVCDFLGVSRDTIYSWIAQRRMPAHRIGRPWRFKRSEVDAWVRAGGATPGNADTTSSGKRNDSADPSQEETA